MTKLCECGCGEPARIATHTRWKSAGYVKGQALRFKAGHWRRTHGYRQRQLVRDGRLTQVAVHRLRAEKVLGKRLPPGAIVHHADGTKDINGPLVICQDRAYHNLLHKRMRVRAAGGDPNTDRICSICKQVLPVTDFRRSPARPDGLQTGCRKCHNRLRLERKRRGDPPTTSARSPRRW